MGGVGGAAAVAEDEDVAVFEEGLAQVFDQAGDRVGGMESSAAFCAWT